MTIPFCLASNRHSILRIVPPHGAAGCPVCGFSMTPHHLPPTPSKAGLAGKGGAAEGMPKLHPKPNAVVSDGKEEQRRERAFAAPAEASPRSPRGRRGKQSVRLSAAAFRAAFPALFGQKPIPTTSAQATLARFREASRKLSRSAALPLQTKPATAGLSFGGV